MALITGLSLFSLHMRKFNLHGVYIYIYLILARDVYTETHYVMGKKRGV